MPQTDDKLSGKQSTINVLWMVVFLLAGLLALSISGHITARDNFTISIPPNLRSGAIARPDEFDAANVYAFAFSTFRELQRWEADGSEDYGKRIDEMTPLVTPQYRDYLVADMNFKNKEGELMGRSRYALEVPGRAMYTPDAADLVTSTGSGTWVVKVAVTIVERVANTEVKRTTIEYPLKVRRGNISPTKNLWGLVLDGYPEGQEPRVMAEEDINISVLD